MAATTRYAAAISALSVLSAVSAGASFPGYPSCIPTTTTVYTTVTVPEGWKASPAVSESPKAASTCSQQYTPNPSWSVPGVTFPTYSPEKPNPNGPYYNPYNYVPEPINWPGLPKKGQIDPPPMPSGRPLPIGGYSASKYDAPHWCLKGSDLKPALSQQDTNGASQWGLIDCPHLPPYLGPGGGSVNPSTTGGSTPTSKPAGGSSIVQSPSVTYSSPSNSTKTSSSYVPSITSSFTDKCVANDTSAACGKMPDTGVTRKYNFEISYGVIAPDGIEVNGILVNGQFPGPLIEANWGDWIEVTVKNNLPYNSGVDGGEPTSMHWHGFLQQETPYYDGVPSVQQCPIPPGKSLTYRFRADQFGTSWYHSHYSAQYSGGAFGPIVVHGPATACYDEDIGPIILQDWYHKDYFTMLQSVMNNTIPLSNNALINGKMNYPCANTTLPCTPNAGISKFKFTPGKKYRLRLINTSAEALMKFTIDGHNFTVFANDFKPVVPYTTQVVTLLVGQRTDVVVEAVGKAGDSYWMRSEMGNALANDGCSFSDGVSTQAVAAVYYDGADTNSVPTSQNGLTPALKNACGNDPLPLTQALCPVPLAADEDVDTLTVDFTFKSNGTNLVWSVNNQTFRANMNQALLSNVIDGDFNFEKEWNVFQFDSSKKAIRIIMRNFFQNGHPMHLHGHDFNVLAVGFGEWDGTITNPTRTLVRDVGPLPPFRPDINAPAYLVIQFNQDNPGMWPLHCHIAWHVSQGLYFNVLEKPGSINYQIPGPVKQTCQDYDAWTSRNIPLQIDSGV
ncbi:uncharacterized protein PV09_02218 [Verruconis gallopava]|uniref:Laccase n=1 Tax=Verruconis gallopava TaxID=253628 RepID=A0A0D2AKK0_9PEZI|nr:uncharacterized protein PV09_02218 [Verruconis gallopava]KIW07373.1 hypothetical protein PV09_02218 [Verruconis gallopava]